MGRTVISQTANKQTVILNDSPEGVEGGYFDEEMVWHEFVVGNTFVNPEVHITAIRGENVDSSIEIPITSGLLNYDGYLVHENFILAEDENEADLSFYATDSDENNTFLLTPDLGGYYIFTYVISNTVNCSANSTTITIDDISEPCSFTITYTEALPIGG